MKPKPDTFTGTLEFTEHDVGARVPGRLSSLSVDEGDEVKNGQVIATLERYDQNKRDYERLQQLSVQGGATRQSVEQAQLSLEDQKIISPVDGVVLTKVHDSGEVVAAGNPVVVVGDRKKVWVKIFVPEGMINRVRLNAPATLKFDGLSRTFKGRVVFVAPKAEFTPRNVQTEEERVTQTFAVKVSLDETEPYLRPGVTAEVSLNLESSSAESKPSH
ncbi:MAG: efflux RND transporter periplasmic adaptor subunit [bacterium]